MTIITPETQHQKQAILSQLESMPVESYPYILLLMQGMVMTVDTHYMITGAAKAVKDILDYKVAQQKEQAADLNG